MTVDGIANSPMGQPAMYEYRYADPLSGEYGKIDKPSFLWAGGFYLRTLYSLFGLKDNEWNVSFNGSLPKTAKDVAYTVAFETLKHITLEENEATPFSLMVDGITLPTSVLPMSAVNGNRIIVNLKGSRSLSLKSVNAILRSVHPSENGVLECELLSFEGHKVLAFLTSPDEIKEVLVDGTRLSGVEAKTRRDGMYEYEVQFIGAAAAQHVRVVGGGSR
jgi:hypothetical protein